MKSQKAKVNLGDTWESLLLIIFFVLCHSLLPAFLRSELPQPKHSSAVPVIQSREEHRPQRSGGKPTPSSGARQSTGFAQVWETAVWFRAGPMSRLPQKMGETALVVWCGPIHVVCAELCSTEHYVHIIPTINQACRQRLNASVTLTSNTEYPNLI